MTIEFTDDEIETIKELINDHGSDCPGTDSDKILALEIKLDLAKNYSEWTVEEAIRRQEFKNSPLAKQMRELFSNSNKYMSRIAIEIRENKNFFIGTDWPINTTLRIKLPNDYENKNE